MFYLKLAWSNLKKSVNIFAPFLLASVVLFVLNCSTLLIMFSPIAESMKYSVMTLSLSIVVLVIFSIIMEIYSYNFLLKQRSREFGLYNILGMNRFQVSLVSTIELILLFIGVVIFGSIFSSIFSHLFYLIFVNLIHNTELTMALSPAAFVINSVIFLGIFVILELIGLHRIRFNSPLVLFRKQEQGEKEPKGNILLAILSLFSIGLGYYLSITSSKIAALAVLYRFFVAVVLVIIGTYLLYISFMTWYLKQRRKNKDYFYQPNHFITTSQMIFRMKQNAVGLANITILAVMAFVAIATTTSLYVNTQVTVDSLFPRNSKITISEMSNSDAETIFQNNVIEKLGKSQDDFISYRTAMISFGLSTDKDISVSKQELLNPKYSDQGFVYLVTQDDFRKLGNELPHLKENQTAFFVQKGNSQLKTLTLLGKKYDNVKNFKSVEFPEVVNTYNPAILVVSNNTVFDNIKSSYEAVTSYKLASSFIAYGSLSKDELGQVSKDSSLIDENGELIDSYLENRSDFLSESYQYTGGFLFTGFLLGLSFLLGAALIIYYKQYSEGVEDKKSYHILQEVGMTSKQVKKSINSQIVLVFFMPLVIAVLHFLAALVMLKQMLLLFGVLSSSLIYIVSATTILAIILIYFFIYQLTSRVYYKIIER